MISISPNIKLSDAILRIRKVYLKLGHKKSFFQISYIIISLVTKHHTAWCYVLQSIQALTTSLPRAPLFYIL
jgi:hypothetical protein